MIGKFLARTLLAALTISTMIFVSGCQKVSGTYKADMMGQAMTITFKSSDKADISFGGTTGETTYKVDGQTITLQPTTGEKQVLLLTIGHDGSLTNAAGMKFTKQ